MKAFDDAVRALCASLAAPQRNRPWRGFIRADRHVKNIEAPPRIVMREVGQRMAIRRALRRPPGS